MRIDAVAKNLGGAIPAGGGEFRPLSEFEIGAIEDEVGVRMPEEYRSLLRRYGALTFRGRSENSPYVYFRSKTPLPQDVAADGLALFDFFYGTEQQAGPSGLQQQLAIFRGRIPETMIPIAGDGGAGQICLGIQGDDAGKVFYWDIANEPLDDESYLEDFGEPMPAELKRQNVHLVADSFDEFLGQLVLGCEG